MNNADLKQQILQSEDVLNAWNAFLIEQFIKCDTSLECIRIITDLNNSISGKRMKDKHYLMGLVDEALICLIAESGAEKEN